LANTRAHGDRSQEIKPLSTRYADRIELIRWRRGPDNPTYEARFKLPGEKTWSKPVSLRTSDHGDAVEEALRRYGKLESGEPLPTRAPNPTGEPPARDDLFRKVADEVVEEMIAHREELVRRHGRGSGKANTVAVHISAIRNRLTPAFGDIRIPDLDGETVNTWAREFEVVARRGPEKGRLVPLSKSHIGSLNHSLQMVLDRAVQKKIIKEHNKPAISQKGMRFRKAQANPTFTFPEMEMLRDHMTDAWVEKGGGRMWEQEASVEVRYLLRAYIALGSCTGIRGGEEMELILPRQVIFEKVPQDGGGGGMVETIRIPILAHQGKYGIERTAFAYMFDAFDAAAILRDLLRWREERGVPKNSPLFAMPSTGRCPNFAPPMKRLLEEIGILVDPKTGYDRVPYSLRHYFATRALTRRPKPLTYDELEKLMGTSADMLRKHYDHTEVLARAAEFSGYGRHNAGQRMAALLRRRTAEERLDPNRIAELDDQPDVTGWNPEYLDH
jgi:hypothetical protein